MENENTDLITFFREINYNWNECTLELGGGTSVLNNDLSRFEITPKDFLSYANMDYELSDSRGYINALSNVKRAIECQSDIIHFSFGIPYKKLNFPAKIENLQKMGLTPSIIIKDINAVRVELEHFYKKPNQKKVEDAIQIAQLFIDVTTLSLSNFWDQFTIYHESDKNPHDIFYSGPNGIYFYYWNKDKCYNLRFYQNDSVVKELYVTSKNIDDYIMLINFSVQIGKHNQDDEFEKKLTKAFLKKIFKNL